MAGHRTFWSKPPTPILYAERTIARQFRQPVDWPAFHPRVLLTARAPRSALSSAPDASFLPQRGTQTFGLGPCCNGCASRAARGLERATLAVVEGTRRCACTLAGAPTPPGEDAPPAEPAATRVDCYTQHLRAHRPRLPPSILSPGVEGYAAKKQYRDAVVSRNLPAITTLRRDAACVWLDTGPHPQRRGARRKDAGQGNLQAWSRGAALGPRADEPPRHLYPAVGWPKTLKRRLRLVVLLNRQDPATPRFIVLSSTAPTLHGHRLRGLYAARCQSALLCRDSHQCPGLLACQARAASAVDWHGNAALATLPLVRAADLAMPPRREPHVFSMASWKQCHCNERLRDVLIEKFALDPTGVKNHACYDELRTYGAIAA